MHMADALLTPSVGFAMYAVSAGAMAYSVHKIKKDELSEKKLPIMAVSGAFVFAAQMINFTIPATGSSGHIGGGMLLAALLGGFPALLTLAAVLLIQCLFFADGGLLALGCNIFNMGVLPCLLIYPLIYKPMTRRRKTPGRLMAASVLSVVAGLQLGAFAVVLETVASGITSLPFSAFVILMQPIHLAIGLVEGLVTGAILAFVGQTRPELLDGAENPAGGRKSIGKPLAVFAALTVVVAGGLSLMASSNPDGLEWSMERVTGTADLEAEGPVFDAAADIQNRTAFLPDYNFPAAEAPSGTAVAGIVGSAMTFALAGAAGFVISRVKKRKRSRAE